MNPITQTRAPDVNNNDLNTPGQTMVLRAEATLTTLGARDSLYSIVKTLAYLQRRDYVERGTGNQPVKENGDWQVPADDDLTLLMNNAPGNNFIKLLHVRIAVVVESGRESDLWVSTSKPRQILNALTLRNQAVIKAFDDHRGESACKFPGFSRPEAGLCYVILKAADCWDQVDFLVEKLRDVQKDDWRTRKDPASRPAGIGHWWTLSKRSPPSSIDRRWLTCSHRPSVGLS